MQLKVAAQPASFKCRCGYVGERLRYHEIACKVAAALESAHPQLLQMSGQLQFAIKSLAIQEALVAYLFKSVGQFEFADEVGVKECIDTRYLLQRRGQRQRAVERAYVLKSSVLYLYHSFRNVERTSQSACMKSRLLDSLQGVGEYKIGKQPLVFKTA